MIFIDSGEPKSYIEQIMPGIAYTVCLKWPSGDSRNSLECREIACFWLDGLSVGFESLNLLNPRVAQLLHGEVEFLKDIILPELNDPNWPYEER